MRKDTDIQSIKGVLIAFLHMPVEKTPVYPIVVQHPIFESGVVSVGGEFADITTEEGFKKAAEKLEERIKSTDDLAELSFIVRKSYYLTFLKYIKPYLSIEDFSKSLSTFWTEEEAPNNDANVPVSLAAKWFKEADKKALMNKEEYEVFTNLPEELIVYRGVASGHNPNGMSWTKDLDKAEWFSNRFGDGYVIGGDVKKKDVLAYFSRREEEELVIEAKNVRNKKTI